MYITGNHCVCQYEYKGRIALTIPSVSTAFDVIMIEMFDKHSMGFLQELFSFKLNTYFVL